MKTHTLINKKTVLFVFIIIFIYIIFFLNENFIIVNKIEITNYGLANANSIINKKPNMKNINFIFRQTYKEKKEIEKKESKKNKEDGPFSYPQGDLLSPIDFQNKYNDTSYIELKVTYNFIKNRTITICKYDDKKWHLSSFDVFKYDQMLAYDFCPQIWEELIITKN